MLSGSRGDCTLEKMAPIATQEAMPRLVTRPLNAPWRNKGDDKIF